MRLNALVCRTVAAAVDWCSCSYCGYAGAYVLLHRDHSVEANYRDHVAISNRRNRFSTFYAAFLACDFSDVFGGAVMAVVRVL